LSRRETIRGSDDAASSEVPCGEPVTSQGAAVNWGGQTDEADALVRTFDSATMSVAYQILMPQGGLTLHMPHKRTSDAGASKEDLQMLMPQRGLTDADASEEGFRS